MKKLGLKLESRLSHHLIFASLSILLLMGGCAGFESNRNADLQIADATLSTSFTIEKDGNRVFPIGQTEIFTLFDKQVMCFVDYVDLTGTHFLRWQWRRPDGRIFQETEEYRLYASPDRIVKRGTAMHKIDIPINLKEKMLGTWSVKIFLDDKPKKEISFDIRRDFGKNYALLIGNDNYEHFDISPLNNAVRDVDALSERLRQQYGFRVKTLHNATREEIINTLYLFQNETMEDKDFLLTRDDNLLIYYTGHGLYDKTALQGYWIPVEASATNRAKWISNADIMSALRTIPAKHLLIIEDSCYSGLGSSKSIGIRAEPGSKSRLAISSGGQNPVSDEGGRDNHSLFASCLLNVLDKNTSILNATDLYRGIRRELEQHSFGYEQIPKIGIILGTGHEDDGNFFFVRNE